MSQINKDELKAVLIDVRKAYRLLYFFQRRVMDTVKFIADLASVSNVYGFPIFCDNQPKKGAKIDFNKWAWDWLNMYMYEFYFDIRHHQSDDIRFAIQIQADTGRFDTLVSSTSPIDFSLPEESESRFLFIASKNRWKEDNPEMYFHDIPALGIREKTNIQRDVELDKIFILKAYPLHEFIDEGAIKDILVDFTSFAKGNGINLNF